MVRQSVTKSLLESFRRVSIYKVLNGLFLKPFETNLSQLALFLNSQKKVLVPCGFSSLDRDGGGLDTLQLEGDVGGGGARHGGSHQLCSHH